MDEITNALNSLRHALENIVAPAVDVNDPIAAEQLVSGVRYLDFVIARIDQIHERERFELIHAVGVAKGVATHIDHGSASSATDLGDALDAAVQAGALALADPAAPTTHIRECTAELRSQVRSALVAGDAHVAERAREAVMRDAATYAEFERAWYLPLGFDPAPDEVPPLEELLLKVPAPDGAVPEGGASCA